MSDYSRYYAILRVTHDLDWTALRARYKRLIGQWHPDRFPSDGAERELAEEHTKEITIAYQALERYYRDHGALPPVGRSSGPAAPATRGAGGFTPTAGGEPRSPTQEFDKPKPRRGQRAFALLGSVIFALYAAYHFSNEGGREPSGDSAASPVPSPSAGATPRTGVAPRTEGISVGSTLGDVYATQGIPTHTEGDTWYYGKSSVRFAQGKVVSWTQHPDNPLRTRDQPVELREGVFGKGSSKDEVRAIQGTPVSETENVWDYGPSRVYFENDRVVGWKASPLLPLHVPH